MEQFNRPLSRKEVNGWDMVQYLSELGHEPQRIRGEDYWYLSPLREERSASFKVFRKGNVWYDHGTGAGGNLMTFCMAYFRCNEEELLSRLGNGIKAPVAHQNSRNREPDDPAKHIQIEDVKSISTGHLKHYLNSRNILLSIAEKYCQEITFSLHRKSYHAIGFQNRFGGYELRNAGFKGSSSPKDITLLETGAEKLTVFEGFFDFLSHQTVLENERGPSDSLILNSLSFVGRATPFLEPYRAIDLYLDQGLPGRKQTQQLLTQFPNATDKSNLYKGYDDFNHWHCESKRNDSQRKKLKIRR